jgi:hypothetical protein
VKRLAVAPVVSGVVVVLVGALLLEPSAQRVAKEATTRKRTSRVALHPPPAILGGGLGWNGAERRKKKKNGEYVAERERAIVGEKWREFDPWAARYRHGRHVQASSSVGQAKNEGAKSPLWAPAWSYGVTYVVLRWDERERGPSCSSLL